MNELLDAVYNIVTHADPAGELRQVDRYIALYHKAPSRFVLPRKHAHLRPLIAHYANKPYLFLALVRRIRNEIRERAGETVGYAQVQAFNRVLKIRLSQSERRERATKLNAWMLEHRPDLSAKQRQDWIEQIEKHWMHQRRGVLDRERAAYGGVLPAEISETLLDAFWEQVEQQIAAGQIPPYQGGDDALELYQSHGI